MSEQTPSPVDWNEARRLAKEGLAMFESILAAVNASAPTLKREVKLNSEVIEIIIPAMAKYFGYSLAVFCSKGRRAELAWARQVAMYFCREFSSATLTQIGNRLGGRDHGTVLHAVRVVENRVSTESRTRAEIERLRSQLQEFLK